MKNSEKHKTPLQNLYAIIDVVAGTFYPPFTSIHDDTAKRSFVQMLTNADTGMSRNPQDFDLYYLGDFDPDDGQIQTIPQPKLLMRGSSTINQPNNNQNGN